LLGGGEAKALLAHFLLGEGIIAEILFQADEDDGDSGAAFARLLGPLVLNVIEGVGRVDAEADENDVGFAVGKGT
jgi:hypothetical protein